MVGPELINSNGGGWWCEHGLMGKSMGEQEGWKYVEESPINPFSIFFSPLISTDYEDEKKIEGLRLGIEEVVEVIKKKDHIIQCWNKEGVRVASHFHYHKGRNFFKWSRNGVEF